MPAFDQILAAITRLAAPAAQQAEFLRAIGTYPSADELALEFSDLVKSKSRLRTECSITDEAFQLIDDLDRKLNAFSGEQHSAEWDASALEPSSNWAEVRRLAMRALDAMR